MCHCSRRGLDTDVGERLLSPALVRCPRNIRIYICTVALILLNLLLLFSKTRTLSYITTSLISHLFDVPFHSIFAFLTFSLSPVSFNHFLCTAFARSSPLATPPPFYDAEADQIGCYVIPKYGEAGHGESFHPINAVYVVVTLTFTLSKIYFLFGSLERVQ